MNSNLLNKKYMKSFCDYQIECLDFLDGKMKDNPKIYIEPDKGIKHTSINFYYYAYNRLNIIKYNNTPYFSCTKFFPLKGKCCNFIFQGSTPSYQYKKDQILPLQIYEQNHSNTF